MDRMRRHAVLSLAGAFILSTASHAEEPRIPAADLQKDLAVLRSAYEQMHPGLYRYNTKQQMDARFTATNTFFQRDRTLREAYLAFTELTAAVRCGHAYPNFFNQTRAIQEELFRKPLAIPAEFRWIKEEMVVTRDVSVEKALPRGTRILSVNGKGSRELYRQLMPLARADGGNDFKRSSYLGVTGDTEFEPFDILYSLLYPTPAEWTLGIVDPAGKRRTVKLKALKYAERIVAATKDGKNKEGEDAATFTWQWQKGNVGLMRMPGWALYNSKWDWRAWINARMDEAIERKAPAIIVDLRGNEGGEDIGDLLVERMLSGPLQTSQSRRFVRYRSAPADLIPYLNTWDPSFRNWGIQARDTDLRPPDMPAVPYFLLVREGEEQGFSTLRPQGQRYTGKLIVLVDSSNSSATFAFAQLVQSNKLGTLVGEPTGGNRRGINGGAFFFVRLPKSGIEVDLPLIASFSESAQPDAGLLPDVAVPVTAADLAKNRDRALETALKLALQ